jgi:asparagine synthase (glutamine-hydrolysing)
MCGIVGIYSYASQQSIEKAEIERMRDAMQSRGPDGAGTWIGTDGKVGLGHRRLAILDLSDAGAQPMEIDGGAYQIVFNGEIYNYPVLRDSLIKQGVHLRSQSDTEVLLYLYKLYGERVVERIRGMFSFAIWDRDRARLFLARDPFGIKPLYYLDRHGKFIFASQVQVLKDRIEANSISAPGLVGYLLLGSVPEPFTLFPEVRSFPAGCTGMVTASQGLIVRRFASVPELLAGAVDARMELNGDRRAELIAEAVQESVQKHLLSDAPLGVFLSAGLDSSMIASAASAGGACTKTITIGFESFSGGMNDEVGAAAKFAAHQHLEHSQHVYSKRELEAHMASFFAAMDQPTIDGFNTYLVSAAAAERGLKVALSGAGADEILGGYSTFDRVPTLVRVSRILRWLGSGRHAIAKVIRPMTSKLGMPKLAELCETDGELEDIYALLRGVYQAESIEKIVDPIFAKAGMSELALRQRLRDTQRIGRSVYAKVAALESCWYLRNQLLRDADWAGMAHSLEIRVPFVDPRLAYHVANLVWAKPRIRKVSVARRIIRDAPEHMLKRAKTGFAIPVGDLVAHPAAGGDAMRNWQAIVLNQYLRKFGREMDAPPFKSTSRSLSDAPAAGLL